MGEIIKVMYLHVDILGPHVIEGHYDVLGPDGQIILPSCWEGTVKPGMSFTMHMWPMDAITKPPPRPYISAGVPPPFPRPPLPPVPHGHGIAGTRLPLPPAPVSLGMPAPPRPPVFPLGPPRPPLPVIIKSRRRIRSRYSNGSLSSYCSDSDELYSDSDVENEEADLGIKIDLAEEKKEAKLSVKELLIKWTNAVDVDVAESTSYSSTDSDTETSLVDD
jgi:hypothetical protein